MYIYNLNTKHIEAVNISRILPAQNTENIIVRHIYHDKDRHIWLATNTNQVIKCVLESNQLKATSIFSVPSVLCITQDRNGTIWAGSFSQAIYALKKVKRYSHPYHFIPSHFHLYSYPTSPLQWRSMDCLLCQQDSFNKSGYMENPDTGHLEGRQPGLHTPF